MKAILAMLIALLACSVIVSAIEIDYKARCDVVRPATEYRVEEVCEGCGIYGVIVQSEYNPDNGMTRWYPELTCFIPGRKHVTAPVVKKPVCTTSTTTVEICETENVCADPVCGWKWTCLHWKHYGCVKSTHVWTCKDPVCNEVTNCYEETKLIKTCK